MFCMNDSWSVSAVHLCSASIGAIPTSALIKCLVAHVMETDFNMRRVQQKD